MKKIAIMQPTYLPWVGYFNLIYHADIFVFLDDVQFAKRSWQQRNRIVYNSKEKMLTIPVVKAKEGNNLIYQIKVDDSQDWRKDHYLTIFHAYCKHPYGSEVINLVESVLNLPYDHLADINVEIIKNLAHNLGLKTEFLRSSQLPVQGKKSEYLLNITKYLNAEVYLSAAGSKEYITNEGFFDKSNVKVYYQNYIPEQYPQKNVDTFIPYMSVIDLIANIGFQDSKQHITKEAFLGG